MRNRSLFGFALLFTLLITSIGCKKDPCKGLICDNGSVCADGSCVCLPGYEGRFCSDESRTPYLGVYNVVEDCDGSLTTFECVISRSTPEVVRIIFSNFANIENSGIIPDVYAEVGTDGTFSIPSQEVEGNTFSGSGTLNEDDTITLTYTRTNAQGTVTCTATFGS